MEPRARDTLSISMQRDKKIKINKPLCRHDRGMLVRHKLVARVSARGISEWLEQICIYAIYIYIGASLSILASSGKIAEIPISHYSSILARAHVKIDYAPSRSNQPLLQRAAGEEFMGRTRGIPLSLSRPFCIYIYTAARFFPYRYTYMRVRCVSGVKKPAEILGPGIYVKIARAREKDSYMYVYMRVYIYI